jgi:hypothetical protein
VIERRFANCSECPDFGCEKLARRLVDYDEVAARIAHPIPASDRSRFIAPYENKRRLDLIRSQRSSGT